MKYIIALIIALMVTGAMIMPAHASAVTHPAGCSVVIDGKHPRAYHLRSGESLRFPDLKVFCWQGTVYIDAR